MKKPLIIITAVALLATPGPANDLKTAPPAAAAAPARAPDVNPKILEFLKPVEPAAGDNELRQKLKERHNSAVRLLEMRVNDYKTGRRDLTAVYEAARLAAEAKLDLADGAEQRGTVLEQGVELTKTFEAYMQKQVDAGVGSKADLERARYARLTAEVQLLKLRQKE